MQVDPSEITYGQRLAVGGFAEVFKGRWQARPCFGNHTLHEIFSPKATPNACLVCRFRCYFPENVPSATDAPQTSFFQYCSAVLQGVGALRGLCWHLRFKL